MPQAASTGMPSVAKLEEKVQNSAATVRAAEERSARMEEFVNEAINLANQSMFGDEDGKIIVGGAMVDKELEGELYSGDEDFEYDQEEYIDELEEIEEEEEEDVEIEYAANVEEKRLEEAEREIGTFVPTTFEEFSAMYRPNTTQPEIEEPVPEPTPEPSIPSAVPSSSSSTKSPEPSIFKNSPLMKKKPPKGAVNKLIYGLHKEPLLSADDFKSSAEAKGEARSVLAAMLSEIHSPPPPHSDPVQNLKPEPALTAEPSSANNNPHTTTTTVISGPVSACMAPDTTASASQPSSKEKHVEFLLPADSVSLTRSEEDLSFEMQPDDGEPVDNGSKENLFIPYDDNSVEFDDELLYEEDDEELDSVLLRQYPSDEEEEPFSDEIRDDVSDVDDSDLMRRLDEKYGKLEHHSADADDERGAAAAEPEDDEDSWTSISTHRIIDGRIVPSY